MEKCHICEESTHYICRHCKKPTCEVHLNMTFIAPMGWCNKCEKEYEGFNPGRLPRYYPGDGAGR